MAEMHGRSPADGGERWYLAGRLSVAGEHQISLGRALTQAEVEDLRAKGRFLRRLADQAGYAQVLEVVFRWEEVLKRLAREFAAGPVSRRSREAATSELRVLARNVERFAAELEREVDHEDPAVDSSREGFDRALTELKKTDGWALLERIRGTPDAPSLRWANARIEVALSPPEGPWFPALDMVYGLAGRCQGLVGAYLELYRERFTDFAVAVRTVSAEVLSGMPSIVTIPIDPESGEESQASVNFEDLPVEEIDAVVEALRRVKGADRTATEMREAEQAEAAEAPAEPPPGMSRPVDPHEPTSEETGPAAEAVDLGALAGQVVEILPELEQAWSEALDNTDFDAARTNTQSSWKTLMLVVQRQVAAGERRLQAAGINSRLPGFPPSAADLAAYDALSADERHWRLMQMAELWAVTRLAEAMGAATEKSGRVVRLPSGETESWWESGAFGLVRVRALALVRIARLARHAETRVVGEELPAAHRLDSDEAFEAGVMAALRGDSEAAVLHCLAALRSRVKHAVGGAEVPEDYLERLGGLPGAPDDGYALGIAARLAPTHLDEERDLGELTVLANLLIPLTAWLGRQVSDEAIRTVFESGEGD